MSNVEENQVQFGSADLHRSGAGYRCGPAVRQESCICCQLHQAHWYHLPEPAEVHRLPHRPVLHPGRYDLHKYLLKTL